MSVNPEARISAGPWDHWCDGRMESDALPTYGRALVGAGGRDADVIDQEVDRAATAGAGGGGDLIPGGGDCGEPGGDALGSHEPVDPVVVEAEQVHAGVAGDEVVGVLPHAFADDLAG